MKAIILARVSTEEQITDGQSIPAQIQRAREYCGRKWLTIQSEYQFDESSIKDHRKKFEIVVSEIRASSNPIALVVETVDRLQRSYKESVLFDEMRKKWLLELHFIRENLVIHQDSNGSDIKRYDMSVLFAKSFILDISDNVKRTNFEKRRNGEWCWPATKGYLNFTNPDWSKTIIANPELAWIITEIFKKYATGNYSYKMLSDWAFEMWLKQGNGKKLGSSGIEFIIHNTFYHGVAFSRKYKTYIPHKYPPLIDLETFTQCQEIASWKRVRFEKKTENDYPFKGVIKCDCCGCTYSPEKKIKPSGLEYVYYSCSNWKQICKREYVEERVLLSPVMEALEKLSKIPPEAFAMILEDFQKWIKERWNKEIQVIDAYKKQKQKLESQISGLVDTLSNPKTSSITREICDKKIQTVNDDIVLLNQKIAQYAQTWKSADISIDTRISLAKNAR